MFLGNSSKIFLTSMIAVAALSIVPTAVEATQIVWADNFTDGDDTTNPAWVHYDYGTGLNPSWTVVDDGTGNMVYQLHVESDGTNRPIIGSYVPIFLHSDGSETNRPIDAHRSNAKGLLTSFNPSNLTGYGLITDITGPDDAHKQFTVYLARLDFGVETVLASTTMPFTTDWMSDYIEVSDGWVRAKKWLTSTPEPSPFLFQVYDNTYTSGGYTGILVGTDPNNPSVTWQFDNVSGSIPEPASLLLVIAGLFGIGLTRRSSGLRYRSAAELSRWADTPCTYT